MELEKYDELRMDIQNLLSCIQHHESSLVDDVVICTLKTIRDICENESCGRDAFRDEGGLDYLLQFLSSTDNTVFLKHCLSTLAFVVDGNVHNQVYMTKSDVLGVLQAILGKTDFPIDVHKQALLLTSAITFQNRAAQSLIADIGLLTDLMTLFETGAPCNNSYTSKDTSDVWCLTVTALNFAVNNPQNDKNQEACSSLLHTSLDILDSTRDPVILKSICSFLSVCISNNRVIQDRFADSDGLLFLRRSLGKYCDAVFCDMGLCNNVIGKTSVENIRSLVAVISDVSEEHEKNSASLGEIGVLSILVKLLSVDLLDVQVKIQITLCLGQCIDCHANSAAYILNHRDFESILRRNFAIKNKELSVSTKYLLDFLIRNSEIECDGTFNHFPERRLSASESRMQPRNSMHASMFADPRSQWENKSMLGQTRSMKSDTSLSERDQFRDMLSSLQHEITDRLNNLNYGKRKQTDHMAEADHMAFNLLSPGNLSRSNALSSDSDDSVSDRTQLLLSCFSKKAAVRNSNLDNFDTRRVATENMFDGPNGLVENGKEPKFSIFAAGVNSGSQNKASSVYSRKSTAKRARLNNITNNNDRDLSGSVTNGNFKQPFKTIPKAFDQCSHVSHRSRASIKSLQIPRQNATKTVIIKQQSSSVRNESIPKSAERRDSCFDFKPVIPNFGESSKDQSTSLGPFMGAFNGNESNDGKNNGNEAHQNEERRGDEVRRDEIRRDEVRRDEVHRDEVHVNECATGDCLKNEVDARSQRKELLDTPSHSNNVVEVIVFPGAICKKHGLISSYERMKIIPLRKHVS